MNERSAPTGYQDWERRICWTSVLINLDGDERRGLTCTCSWHFDNRSSVLFITSVTFSLFCSLCLYKTGNFEKNLPLYSFVMIYLTPRSYMFVVFLVAWWIKWQTFTMKTFLLGCSFSFKVYAKKRKKEDD